MRNRGLLLSATLFALSLLIPSLSGSSVYADEKSVVGAGNGIRSVSAIGRAPVQLQCNPDLPCSFSTEYKAKIPRESGTLLSIDSIYLKGKTEREIEKLLEGPIGSTAEIGALDTYGALKIIKLEREKLSRANGDALKDLRQTISGLDYGGNVFEGDSRRAEDAEAQNLDLLTRSYCDASVQGALSLPGPKSSAVGDLAARAIIVSDMIGDLSAADQYLQLVLKNPDFDLRFDGVYTDSYKLVTHLITTGQVKEAEALCRDFIEIAERDGKKQRIGYSQVQRNLQILRELLLQVLMAKKGEKPNKEALAVARELVDDVTSEKNGFWTSDSLHPLARSLEELCDYKRSCQIYAHRLKNERLKDGPNEDPHPGLQRVRDYCDDAYHLAQMQEKLGQPDQAIETAKKALEDYNLFLKAEQQTFAEQLDNYFPAGSDLELLLARLYLNSKKFDLARDLAQKSVKRIETALGPKSALIAKSLDLCARADDGLGQKSAATEARKRLAALERPSSFVETSDSEKFVLLRTASTAVEKGDAKNSINRLVEIYDRQGPVSNYKRRALNLFASLIGLSRRLSDKGRFAESDALLEKIAAIAARDEFTPVADKFIEVEKAYNRACRKKEAHVTWPQLAPEFMVSQLVHESGIPQPIAMRLNPELSKQENFRVLAEIYGDGGETKRAEFFMNRAIATSDRALSAAQSGGAVASSLVARTKIILLLDAARIRARAKRLDEHMSSERELSRFPQRRLRTKVQTLAISMRSIDSRSSSWRKHSKTVAKAIRR
jgi:tetratricopeptide (TPR) repeat protein